MSLARARSSRRRSRGAVALEFALLLPVLVLIVYGLVVYALVFAAQHTLVQAASEGARVALRYGTEGERKLAACNAANAGTGWITSVASVAPSCTVSADCSNAPCWRVRLTYDYAARPLVPLPALLAGFVPARLQSDAVVHFTP